MPVYEILFVGTSFALLAIIWTMIAPRLAVSRESESAVFCWIDLWIPLVLAVPTAASMLLCGPAAEIDGSGWFAVGPVLTASAVACGVIVLTAPVIEAGMVDRYGSSPGPSLADSTTHADIQALALIGLGALLLGIGLAGRFASWHGQVLWTAAIIWLWMSNPTPQRPQGGHRTAARPDSAETTRPRFLTHWGGTLSHRVPLLCKVAIMIVLMVQCAAAWLARPYPIVIPSMAGAVLVGMTGLAVAWKTGRPLYGIRLISSTVVLSVLLSLGALAIGLVPYQVESWFGDPNGVTFHRTFLPGLHVLMPTGIALTGMAVGLRLLGPGQHEDSADATDSGLENDQPALPPTAVWIGMLLIVSGLLLTMPGCRPIAAQFAFWKAPDARQPLHQPGENRLP